MLSGSKGNKTGVVVEGARVIRFLPSVSPKAVPLPFVSGCSSHLQECPCGYYGDRLKPCTCSPVAVARYQKRISGPLMDRIDMFVEVPRIEYDKLADDSLGEGSEKVRARVERGREVQRGRFKGRRLAANSEMTVVEVREFCKVEGSAQGLLKAAMKQFSLSARGFHRILKLSRTIADLDGVEVIGANHLAEALQYRPRNVA